MIKIEPSDELDGQPLDLSVKRKKLVSEKNFPFCRDDKFTVENKCKLIAAQSCINPSTFENIRTINKTKLDSVPVKEPEIVKDSAKCNKNHNWKILGKAYFQHVFVSVSMSKLYFLNFLSLFYNSFNINNCLT